MSWYEILEGWQAKVCMILCFLFMHIFLWRDRTIWDQKSTLSCVLYFGLELYISKQTSSWRTQKICFLCNLFLLTDMCVWVHTPIHSRNFQAFLFDAFIICLTKKMCRCIGHLDVNFLHQGYYKTIFLPIHEVVLKEIICHSILFGSSWE